MNIYLEAMCHHAYNYSSCNHDAVGIGFIFI